MACNCGKNRQRPVTGFAVQTTPLPATPTPYRLTRPDGSTEDYPSRIAAYAAQIAEGGGSIAPVENAS